jgi:hypothetical protein
MIIFLAKDLVDLLDHFGFPPLGFVVANLIAELS